MRGPRLVEGEDDAQACPFAHPDDVDGAVTEAGQVDASQPWQCEPAAVRHRLVPQLLEEQCLLELFGLSQEGPDLVDVLLSAECLCHVVILPFCRLRAVASFRHCRHSRLLVFRLR